MLCIFPTNSIKSFFNSLLKRNNSTPNSSKSDYNYSILEIDNDEIEEVGDTKQKQNQLQNDNEDKALDLKRNNKSRLKFFI